MADSNDYPTGEIEFEKRFRTEDDCIEYLVKIRWPDGPRCPACNGDKFWRTGIVLICSHCKHHVRVLAGTIFQDTHLPLMVWLRVIWFITISKQGCSAVTLQNLMCTSYKTMWNMLHKLRRAMVRPGRDRLAGKVEIDETYIGGLSEGTPGRGADKKALVVIAAQIADKGSLGRVRMKMIDRATTENLVGFMEESVEPGSTIITDGWAGYSDKVMAAKGYEHVLDEVKPGKDALPHVHMVISLLKRVLLGTFQGGVAFSHLSYYLDEFTFRFNRRTSRNRGKLFRRLLENNVDLPPTTWKELVGPSEKTDEQPQEELD